MRQVKQFKNVVVVEYWYDKMLRVFADDIFMFWSTNREEAEVLASLMRASNKLPPINLKFLTPESDRARPGI